MVAPNQMIEIRQLLADYSFDVEGSNIDRLITRWLQQFDPIWIHNAIVEALYQGRYKAVSVDQILNLWQRRGSPLRHYTREFESIILGPNNLREIPAEQPPSASPPQSISPAPEATKSTPSPPAPPPVEKAATAMPVGDAIPPFVPRQEESELYHRLQAVAHRALTR